MVMKNLSHVLSFYYFTATARTYGCQGFFRTDLQSFDHFVVYWMGPICGALSAYYLKGLTFFACCSKNKWSLEHFLLFKQVCSIYFLLQSWKMVRVNETSILRGQEFLPALENHLLHRYSKYTIVHTLRQLLTFSDPLRKC